jgi:hypothetical protein
VAGQPKGAGEAALTEQAGGLEGNREPAVAACCSVCWTRTLVEGFVQCRTYDCLPTGVVTSELEAGQQLRVAAAAELW